VSHRTAIELFHLVFLAELGRRLDRRLYAVKGGCNLRFFFHSPRYSEDLDLDVHTIAVGTLRKKITDLLGARPLALLLASKQLRVIECSAPKQTETTQRWKVALDGEGVPGPLHTKIEFSRRKADDETAFDPVDPVLIAEHGIAPLFAPHYTARSAFAQKVRALARRPETQARDLFDLDLLLRGGLAGLEGVKASRPDVDKARANAVAVDFDAFNGQVIAFLPSDQQRVFGTRLAWKALIDRVVRALEGVGP
jgi:hypothetical protein